MLKFSLQSRLTRYVTRLLVLLLGGLGSYAACAYQLVDLGADVSPMDINNYGVVVGSRNTSQYPPGAFRFSASSGQFEDLPGIAAHGVNDAGQVAGTTLTGAFLLDGSNLHTWDEYGAFGLSETGSVSGNAAGTNPYRTTSIPYDPAILEGNHWTVMNIAQVYPRGTRQGVYADIYQLDDVNDNGFAVGSRRRYGLAGSSAIMIAPPYSAVSDASGVIYLPSPYGGVATAINNRNVVVGTSGNSTGVTPAVYASAFVYDGDTLSTLDPLQGGLRSRATDINEFDQVVGSSETDTLNHAFVWDTGSGMVDLNTLISDPQWVLVSAVAINDQGDIVGTGQLNGVNHGFLLSGGELPPLPPPVNQPPVAVAVADVTSGKAPLDVVFSGAGSHDPDGGVVAYSWDFGDMTSGSAMNPPVHTYSEPGTYLVVLSVTDDAGMTSESAPLEIRVRKAGGRKKR